MEESAARPESELPSYLVMDTETIPDGKLLNMIKYPGQGLSPEDAVERAQAEARERSSTGSDFLPVSFQIPVAICIIRVGADLGLQSIKCLDAPAYRPRQIVEEFWRGLEMLKDRTKGRVRLVTFNGRGFDLPLLELAAFRYGCSGPEYFRSSRNRYQGELDLMDWLTNFGAYRITGGLHLLSKLLGQPGKMEVAGHQVYGLYREGKHQEINDYCMFDTLDTYFVFLRSRLMQGEINLGDEKNLVMRAKEWIQSKTEELPALRQYLDNWGDWQPWP